MRYDKLQAEIEVRAEARADEEILAEEEAAAEARADEEDAARAEILAEEEAAAEVRAAARAATLTAEEAAAEARAAAWTRPCSEQGCGCVYYPGWQSPGGTVYRAWTATVMCRRNHEVPF